MPIGMQYVIDYIQSLFLLIGELQESSLVIQLQPLPPGDQPPAWQTTFPPADGAAPDID